jgi:Zn-dependent M28 family amino/carboxypeptidase
MTMKMLLPLVCSAAIVAGCGEKPAPVVQGARTHLLFTAAQASNALAHVAAFVSACTPRDGGTPGSERAALWLRDRLAASGVTATVDRFADETPSGPQTFANVLATLPGESDEWIVLLSHFDTKNGISADFQGANDGGSSTGLLLELASVVQASAPRKFNVLCAFLDGEECRFGYSDRDGFHGSKRLARQLKEQRTKIRAVILADMVGDRNLKLTLPRNGSAALRVLALEAAEATGNRDKVGLFDGDIYDDHQAFLALGYPAVDLIDFDYGSSPGLNDYWHTSKDTLDKLSAESLHATGSIVVEMLNRL